MLVVHIQILVHHFCTDGCMVRVKPWRRAEGGPLCPAIPQCIFKHSARTLHGDVHILVPTVVSSLVPVYILESGTCPDCSILPGPCIYTRVRYGYWPNITFKNDPSRMYCTLRQMQISFFRSCCHILRARSAELLSNLIFLWRGGEGEGTGVARLR